MTPQQWEGNEGSREGDSDQLWETNGAHTQGCPWSEPQPPTQAALEALLALESHLLHLPSLLWQSTWFGERKNIHLKRIEPLWTQSSGLLFQQLGVISYAWHGGMRKSYLILSASFSSSIFSPIPTKVIPTSTPWGKMWLASTSHQHSYQRH